MITHHILNYKLIYVFKIKKLSNRIYDKLLSMYYTIATQHYSMGGIRTKYTGESQTMKGFTLVKKWLVWICTGW